MAPRVASHVGYIVDFRFQARIKKEAGALVGMELKVFFVNMYKVCIALVKIDYTHFIYSGGWRLV